MLPTLAEAYTASIVWRRKTFGAVEDPAALARKIVEEALELLAEPGSAEEMADVAIVLFGLAEGRGVHLPTAIMDKLAVLENRTWAPPDENGVTHHIPQEAGGAD